MHAALNAVQASWFHAAGASVLREPAVGACGGPHWGTKLVRRELRLVSARLPPMNARTCSPKLSPASCGAFLFDPARGRLRAVHRERQGGRVWEWTAAPPSYAKLREDKLSVGMCSVHQIRKTGASLKRVMWI